MGMISTVALQTKMDVQELLSRFCHYIDHGNAAEWSRLFTLDGTLDVAPLGVFTGREDIETVPALVHQKGGGLWRHHLSNVMFDRTADPRELEIRAYCLTTDWGKGGALAHCFDFHAVLRNRCHWQIAHLVMTPVDPSMTVPPQAEKKPLAASLLN